MNTGTGQATDVKGAPVGVSDREVPGRGTGQSGIICVDLDGTLIRANLLLESLVAVMSRNPFVALPVLLWLLRGKAYLAAQLGRRAELEPSVLPYNTALIDYLRERRCGGDLLYLVTAAYGPYARAVSRHLDLFDGVLASEHGTNHSGVSKLGAVQQMTAGRPFVYVGDALEDVAIWRHASSVIQAGQSRAVMRALRKENLAVVASFSHGNGAAWRHWPRALRLYQWSKNVLIFAPILLSHKLRHESLLACTAAFLAWSTCASGFYVVNDLMDIQADRLHPRKRRRPIASGELSVTQGLALATTAFAVCMGVCLFLPVPARLLLGLYAAVNLAYSMRLKQELFLDVIVLAGFYTLRLMYGGAASGTDVSIWTLAFSMFLFLGLALVKRLAELTTTSDKAQTQPSRRAYMSADTATIVSLASSALYLCVLVLALYINSPEVTVLYQRPQALWLVCVLLIFWVSRVLILTNRGNMPDDPIVFAFRDSGSQVVGVLVALSVWFAL